MKLDVKLPGSAQNPTFSPDGKRLLVTVWHDGYNEGHADLFWVNLRDLRIFYHVTYAIGGEGFVNVSQPGLGSCWHKSGRIIFSSTERGNDWPCTIKPDGSEFSVLPGYSKALAGYEPTLAPNGVDFAFEQHAAGEEDNGSIVAFIGGKKVTLAGPDSRQPSWSPTDDCVVYQHRTGHKWNLWLAHFDRKGTILSRMQITDGDEVTDATWHPNGDRILCSADGGLYEVKPGDKPRLIVPAKRPIRYLGAPSWSPDGKQIVAEADTRADPEGGEGTWIEVITAAQLTLSQEKAA